MGGRLIDVDALKTVNGMKDDCADCDKELRGKSKACEFDRVYTKMDFCGWLDDAPTVDAVPVVQCRDCKHCQYDSIFGSYWCGGRLGGIKIEADFFCKDGEQT